jgi:RHH-type proline utilization regulon transcriptional repressor/proline dehydrogenase/delta 1-pyrroline-5-carboxylate dehydrogenase
MTDLDRKWIAEEGAAIFATASRAIGERYLADEERTVRALCECAALDAGATEQVLQNARKLTRGMRERGEKAGSINSLMTEYDLSSKEGVVLMCLAEALLRIPDAATANELIADKLGQADFHEHLGDSRDVLVNVSTWGLMLSGRLVKENIPSARALGPIFGDMLARLGEPIIRMGMKTAMRIMSEHFVMGQTIEAALARGAKVARANERYSFDMLGEAALTTAAADDYFTQYAHAIDAIGAARDTDVDFISAPSISVKLSALSARFEHAHVDELHRSLVPRLQALAERARVADVALTVDAEDAERLEATLSVFENVYRSLAASPGSAGFGIAVQAYQQRGLAVVAWLAELARECGVVIPVRLVKGAYWDTEIKLAQMRGLAAYPVFTRKCSTDVSFLACARSLLASAPHLYPQFATHNPHTAAWVMHEGRGVSYELQRLHGMGEALYEEISARTDEVPPCRVYAPVGRHKDLLPYLVRRLLENGANTSFVNRFVHAEQSVDELIQDPVAQARTLGATIRHPRITLPRDLFEPVRENSAGLNLHDPLELSALATDLRAAATADWQAAPFVAGKSETGDAQPTHDPSYPDRVIGSVVPANTEIASRALASAHAFFPTWNATPAAQRAAILRDTARQLEARRAELVALCVTEGGRTVPDAVAEVREAVDFLRYYAGAAEALYGEPVTLPGPTGETNTLQLEGRGVFLCISPWNFPIAIFTGQIAAALAAGNTVIAKPAEQTPLVARQVVTSLVEAGLPVEALQFLPGSGPVIGGALLPDARISGVAFTGSTATAKTIEQALATREGPIAVLIAETGGINAMLADSSALTEQVVKDAVASAFNSAGQRCSALRLLCVPHETADEVIGMLTGRMDELVIGDPAEIRTDVGPVIDREAFRSLEKYVDHRRNRVLHQRAVDARFRRTQFFPPTLIELDRAGDLRQEVFGPVLHVIRYDHDEVDDVIDELNAVGYGLTLGIQSRVESFSKRVAARMRVGNIYVNRDMIGAVVGSQPFGGLGLSGTGPKAGGPHYIARFGVEKTLTINTAAFGGNPDLLAMDDAPEW